MNESTIEVMEIQNMYHNWGRPKGAEFKQTNKTVSNRYGIKQTDSLTITNIQHSTLH